MKQNIAIEPDLTPINEYLTTKGYNVESLNFDKDSSKHLGKYDALIVTGLNTNFMGINDTSTKAIVINAAGMSPEQVYHELQLRLE